ncbi:hypothetical protein BGAL_0005g00250 [Botrytis galanthina]|uniref:Uncharacterized protein n=1 Tax=Botrytis galanthina TaxID=278940 RepID=A0A4V4HW36_9HELO|nr:hypothetical protein BGAL_0005g00250 [Botrytis galanthina]
MCVPRMGHLFRSGYTPTGPISSLKPKQTHEQGAKFPLIYRGTPPPCTLDLPEPLLPSTYIRGDIPGALYSLYYTFVHPSSPSSPPVSWHDPFITDIWVLEIGYPRKKEKKMKQRHRPPTFFLRFLIFRSAFHQPRTLIATPASRRPRVAELRASEFLSKYLVNVPFPLSIDQS